MIKLYAINPLHRWNLPIPITTDSVIIHSLITNKGHERNQISFEQGRIQNNS